MDLEEGMMGRREARARVAAEEAMAPPVDLRREKAGLAATEAMWRLKMMRLGESVRSQYESVIFRRLGSIYIIILSLMSGSKMEHL